MRRTIIISMRDSLTLARKKIGHPHSHTVFQRVPRDDVLALLKEGYSKRQVANYYGVGITSIRQIELGRTEWPHIPYKPREKISDEDIAPVGHPPDTAV
jgi:hypothetical protein